MAGREHFVQFYETDEFLVESVSGFIGAAIQGEEGGIIVATEAHREAILQRFKEGGVDVCRAEARGRFVCLDAAGTLAKFMVNGTPNAQRFMDVVGGVVARVGGCASGVRAFGEMVAILWGEGNGAAAIRLEELWNELATQHTFSLFCAYPISAFNESSQTESLQHICQTHTHVIPAESYTGQTDGNERLRQIAMLQHKAASLEAEVVRRRETEERLAQREAELRDFLENASEGIHQVAEDGRILWANKAELELLGYRVDEYVGHNITEFHADADVIADILARLKRREVLYDYEARLKCKDGSIRDVSLNSSVYWEGDQFRYTRCFTRDVTERKRAAEILEKTVVERTAKLQEVVSELEAFSYSISHDMRSPLRAMQGHAKALMDDHGAKLGGEGIASLQRIQRAATRLDLLVRDILAYSKVAKGQIQLTRVAIEPLIEDIVDQHPASEIVKNCIHVRQPMHSVWGHEAYLTQCLSNLISNALKFVAPGTVPEVTIRTEAAGDQIRVWVCDNGVGIESQHADRVFKIFGRVHPDKRFEGTGIGLAIVKKAVNRMGGDVGFDSEPGQGSRFWFTVARAPQ